MNHIYDDQQIALWCRSAAEHGDAQAQLELGKFYEMGKGVPRDFEEAAAWYLKAAERGHAEAQFHLGELYHQINLLGLRDDEKAAVWYLKAAEQGHKLAQYEIGRMYLLGIGVQQDCAKAAAWLKSSAYKGYCPAQELLGSMYLNGEGISQDLKQASILFILAAASGYLVTPEHRRRAEERVDEILVKLSSADRREVEETASKWLADNWYHEAAQRGYVHEQFTLGLLYERGCGVPQNYEEAYFWLHLAAARSKGPDQSRYERARDGAGKKLTQQSLSKVLERAAKWLSEHLQP